MTTAREYKHMSPEKRAVAAARSRKWRAANPEQTQNHNLARYGLTVQSFGALLEAQGGVCAACSDKFQGTKNRHIDHDHETGLFRGILCHWCNIAIGHVRESPERADKLAEYLRKAKVR